MGAGRETFRSYSLAPCEGPFVRRDRPTRLGCCSTSFSSRLGTVFSAGGRNRAEMGITYPLYLYSREGVRCQEAKKSASGGRGPSARRAGRHAEIAITHPPISLSV